MPTLYLEPGYTRDSIPEEFWKYTKSQYDIVKMNGICRQYFCSSWKNPKPNVGDILMRAPDDWLIRVRNRKRSTWKNWDFMGTIYHFVFPDGEDYVGKSKCFKSRLDGHSAHNLKILELGPDWKDKVKITTWRVPLDELDHYERIFINFFPATLNTHHATHKNKKSKTKKRELAIAALEGKRAIKKAKHEKKVEGKKAQQTFRAKRRQNNTGINTGIKLEVKGNYSAQIYVCGEKFYLGMFDTAEEARAARERVKQRAIAAAKQHSQ